MGSLIWFSQILCLSFMLLQFRVQSASPSQSSLSSPHLCRSEERSALLDFKSTTNLVKYCSSSSDIKQTWNESKDCCLWEGITCDKPKGHVIGLDLSSNCLEANLTTKSSLFRLEKLQSLNLAYNEFSYPNISFGFHNWKSLTYLNLSNAGSMDSSLLFDEISLLSKLVSLDLSSNYGLLNLDNIKFQMLVHNLTELRFLILDSVDMSSVVPSSLLNLTPSLEHLSLRSCNLQRNFPSQVFQLKKLVSLDLFGNDDLLLDNIKFQMLVHNLTELRFLILDFVNMSPVVPSSLLNLTSSLEHLSLSSCNLQGNFPNQVFQLPSLQFLDLSYNYYLRGNLLESNCSSTLEYLNLANTNFSGELPHSIGNLKFLKKLNLDSCQFYGSIPRSLANLTELTDLRLDANNFGGEIPASIFNLTHLTFLSLSSNKLLGHVPSWLFSLPSISYLDLHNNCLTGPIDHVEMPNLILQRVYLSNNEISGSIPSSFFDLVNLTRVNLSSNNLSGTITSDMLLKLVDLEELDLSNNSLLSLSNNDTAVNYSFPNLLSLKFSSCNIHKFPSFLSKAESLLHLDISNSEISGSIPSSFFDLVNLIVVDLSSNNLGGTITANMLSKLVNLRSLDLSNNSLLSLSNNGIAVNYSFPNLQTLKFSSCNIHKFPSFLRKAESLRELDISKNNISGQIHKWEIEGMSLRILNLSYNFLTGIDSFGSGNLETVDLRSNLLQGSLPIPSTWDSMQQLFISGNNLNGEIPFSYCNLTSLGVLDLAYNSLGGKIPECLGNLSNLAFLDLRMNKFQGRIPNSFVNKSELRTLTLNGNQLEGILPRSLVNCSNLEILDVGNNNLNDTFPDWLGVLPSLKVLILRSNGFHGAINNSMPASYFPQLRIIDVAQNDFMGLLPSNYFQILRGMRDVATADKLEYIGDGQRGHLIRCTPRGQCVVEIPQFYYKDSVKVVMKGSERELVRILKFFTTIDFSSNQFHGSIPEELGELNSLKGLNLSHNSLTGQIPSSLGKLAELESLDLSSNKLEGRIPEQLTKLTFLSVLNLSHNELVGHIPEGKQFNSFSNDSYIGNSGLYGCPLTKNCHEEEEPVAPPKFDEEDDSATLFEWKFALAGYGCGLVLGLSLGYIAFTTGKPWWVVKEVEKYQQKLVGRCKRRHKKRKTEKPNQCS
ncbi:hypothetical protein SLEP1_g53701 [Rubroshorea leprosula]|uniref:Leucine-rich repeat-containing N-terminal plant-type domain-containing protein n=1 Tax=Rubroshorea leprosula TaxID=152421 RepID=A0AAV5MA89_9ROSI|nr:hypothetical protein SLEP1_g53701 [Rubroshorea leprosula]